MAPELIAAHRIWDGPIASSNVERRFAAALGVASQRPAETRCVADTLVAATGKTRGWRPPVMPDGSHVLFAGYIDNRRQLCRELGVAYDCDASLYAAGLAAWGDPVDLRAIGQFSSIVVDSVGKTLRLVRSPVRAPPLHYWHDAERFIVSSIGNAIFSTGEIECRLDRQKIADSLYLNYNEGPRSWFEGVRRLACGQRAIVSRDGVAAETFYQLAALPEIRLKDDEEYLRAADELFEQGVAAALEGYSRPAIRLSGGFDSQAVAAYAARSRPGQRIEAFTGVPEAGWDGRIDTGAFGDERAHVEALAAMYPEINPHWVDAAGLSFDHKLPAMFLLAGASPRNAANLHWLHEIYAQASKAKCDVMLCGDAGNLTFSYDGKEALASLARQGKLLRLWKDAPRLLPSRSRVRAMIVHGLLPNGPRWLYAALLKARAALWSGEETDAFATWCPLNRGYAIEMDVDNRARALGFDALDYRPESARQARIDAFTQGEEDGADIVQAFDLLHGIQTRDPTAYRPLIEFCLGIPEEQYLRGGQTRWLARRMLKGLVPNAVLSEMRRGRQAADWHLRIGRQRKELIAEIDRLACDDDLSKMLNFRALRRGLVEWPERTPLSGNEVISLAMPRGLATARFIRFFEGRND